MSIKKAFLVLLFFSINLVKASLTNVSEPQKVPDLPPIEIVGNKFFNSATGEQFFLKGIAYQPRRGIEDLEKATGVFETKYLDPLADTNICLRDIPYLKKLDVNVIRVYSIDPTKDHDICMAALAKEGIYVVLDLAEPDISIVRNNPTWDVDIYERYISVIDAMQNYTNVMGFFAGNEVTNDKTNTDASPFVKAAIRDIKSYIKEMGYREIPVGYSTNDDPETRDSLAKYFICGDVTADFYGINMYEWCGYSSYGTSGYKERTEEFKDYPIPIFFSEFGCNLVNPRPFTECKALYGPKMTGIWSGGLVYMYFEEENRYGVVKIDPSGNVIELEDFKYLQEEFNNVNPLGIKKQEYLKTHKNSTLEVNECPDSYRYPNWRASEILPESPDKFKCECLNNYLPCVMEPLIETEKTQYQELFDYIANQVDCSDIYGDGVNGIYGDYSDCSVSTKVSIEASKKYYEMNDETLRECPIKHKNIYFNIRSINMKKNDKCKKIIDEFKLNIKKKNSKDDNVKTSSIVLNKKYKTSSSSSKFLKIEEDKEKNEGQIIQPNLIFKVFNFII